MSVLACSSSIESKKAPAKTKAVFVLLLFYLAIVLCYTVFMRSSGFYLPQYELFWSYKRWLAGDWGLGREILYNIGMFIPFGFLLSATMPSRKRLCLTVAVAGFLFSFLIEFLQLELMRGVFEYDDIFNNTLGAVSGYLVYKVTEKLTGKGFTDTIALFLGTVFVATGMFFCFHDNVGSGIEKSNVPRGLCVQIDRAELNGDRLILNGFAFVCDRVQSDLSFTLRSVKTGKEIKPDVQYGFPRQDVADYFNNGEQDYTRTGFAAIASGVRANEEYEVFVNMGRFVTFPAGVYVTGTDIHYAKQEGFIAPEVAGTGLEEIVKNGYLRVYRPDRGCYVYQYKGDLYWIADPSFAFENNGKTYIQYHLWTTQIDKLPKKRLKNKWYFDNIGGYFEKHEITGVMDCGRYRVCKRKLPVEYAITSVETGYYKYGKWVWSNSFRPVYEW